MNQNNTSQNKSLFWIIFTIEANIAMTALFIGFSQIFFSFLPAAILQNQIFRFFLLIIITFLLSIWATRRGVKTVLKTTIIKPEDILKISFWVGFIPLVLAVFLFILGRIKFPLSGGSNFISNIIASIVTAITYGSFTYFWLKKLNSGVKTQFFSTPISPAPVGSVGSQLKKGMIIGLILVSALVAYAFLGQMFHQKAVEKILKSENREEIQKKLLEQFSPICQDESEGAPVITSLSSYSLSVDAEIEIMGCNFSGFEGDKNAWIENSQGVKGLLRGGADSTTKLLRVALNSPLCQKDTSYSGLPCDAWLTLTPGVYKIYVLPWGKKSNEVIFTIK